VRWFSVFVLLAVGGCGGEDNAESDRPNTWVIQNVNVVDTRAGVVVPDQSVIIKGSTIASVIAAKSRTSFADARVIDGSGKYLIPGLWDMHIHTSTDEVSRNTILPLMIANGVTGVRSMAGDCHIDIENGGCGEPVATITDVRKWREEIDIGTLVGPRVVASSYYTNGPDSISESSVNNPATAEHARMYARLLKDRGVDLIKVYGGMYREAYFAMAEEARSIDLEFGGEIPLTVRASEASEAGHSTIEHATGFFEECSANEDALRAKFIDAYATPAEYWATLIELVESFDDQKCARLYAVLAKNGTWHVPTLNVAAFNDQLRSPRGEWRVDERMKYVPSIEAEMWDDLENLYFGGIEDYKTALQPLFRKEFELSNSTYRAGVPMLAGSDAGEYGIIWGFSLHTELELLTEAGLTNAHALQAATLNPAIYRGMEDSLGTVEAGKLADLVLLDADPLVEISNTQRISAVIANGRVFFAGDLDELLQEVESYVQNNSASRGSANAQFSDQP